MSEGYSNAKKSFREALKNKLSKNIAHRQRELSSICDLQNEAIDELETLRMTVQAMIDESKHSDLVQRVIDLTNDIQGIVELSTAKLESIEEAISSMEKSVK